MASLQGLAGLVYALGDAVDGFLRPGPHLPRRVKAPALEGRSVAEARRVLALSGVRYELVLPDHPVPPVMGKVAKQSPPPGTWLRRSTDVVTLILSFEPARAEGDAGWWG